MKVLHLDVDDLYYLLHLLPPNTITIHCYYVNSLHDSWDDYYVTIPEGKLNAVRKALTVLYMQGKINNKAYRRYLEQLESESWQKTNKVWIESPNTKVIPEEEFLNRYNGFRDSEITAIDRRFR